MNSPKWLEQWWQGTKYPSWQGKGILNCYCEKTGKKCADLVCLHRARVPSTSLFSRVCLPRRCLLCRQDTMLTAAAE